ncbi:MAG: hypothetical protein AVO34_02025 [Firmicutes bacterium ML8_F2]|jgi:capsular polysaccharide biosynthesis protein|nr:MAG: hypothetical protein AVO34_02025 [Firmicutes bacterium ML8_F2]
MNYRETIKIIYRKKWLVFWLTVLGAVLAFDLAVIQTPEYKSVSKVLIIQKQTSGQDIYSVSKSAQYLSQIMKEIIYSDSFFEKTIESSNKVDFGDFSEQHKKRQKQWERTVKVNIVRDLGMIEINVFHPEQKKAEQINSAIADTLEQEHRFYHGGGQNVELRILDKSLVSQKPVTLDLWTITVLGALIGLFVGSGIALRKGLKHKDTLYYKDEQGLLLADEASSLDRNDFSV